MSSPSTAASEPRNVNLGNRFAQELRQVILVGLSPTLASRLTQLLGTVAPQATVTSTRLNRLEPPQTAPRGTLLVLPDQSAEGTGVVVLRNMRSIGVETPTLLLVVDDDFQCPRDVDLLGDLDILPLSELSRFSLRRSLVVLGARLDSRKLLHDVAGRLRSSESALATKDRERQQALNVAGALEKRLSVAETELRNNEAAWAERLARADARIEQLELRLAASPTTASPTAVGASAGAAEQVRHQREQQAELDIHREARRQQDATIAELRKLCAEQEHELHKAASHRQQISELTTRLAQADRSRGAQSQE
ncbi:MAG: hypothetical protein AAF560_06400, partial [Acidobacteriota bacterium]